MRFLVYLFYLLHNNGNRVLVPNSKPVVVFNPTEFRLIALYHPFARHGEIEDIGWNALLRRTFAFSMPPSFKNKSLPILLKIWFIHCFYGNTFTACRIFSLIDAILGKAHPLDLYVDGPHLMEIFHTHFPSFQIGVASTRHQFIRDRLIRFVAALFRDDLLDSNEGRSIFLNFENEILLRTYRELHPKRTVIIRFCDTIEPRNLSKLRNQLHNLLSDRIINRAESYYEQDALSLGIQYRPNSVSAKSLEAYRFDYCRYLYALIGVSNTNQSRIQEFHDIRRQIHALYPCITSYAKELVTNRVAHFISYTDYLTHIGSSEIIVDLYRRFPREGFSFRTAEALVLNKKTITNRQNIRESWFYHPNRFFIIGYDSPTRLQSFLESDCPPLPRNQLEQFTTDNVTY